MDQFSHLNLIRTINGFCKLIFSSKQACTQAMKLDITDAHTPDVSIRLIKYYIHVYQNNDWMSWYEFGQYLKRNQKDLLEEYSKADKVIKDPDYPIYEGNMVALLDRCKAHKREMIAMEIVEKANQFQKTDFDQESTQEFSEELIKFASEIDNTRVQTMEDDELDVYDSVGMIERMKRDRKKFHSGSRFTIGLYGEYMPPIEPGHFVVFQAEPKRGKSTIKREISAMNMKAGFNGIYISTEMQPKDNQLLFASMISEEDSMCVYSKEIVDDPEKLQRFQDKYDDFLSECDSYFKFLYTSGDVNDVRSKILIHKKILEEKGKTLDFVVIDHILDLKDYSAKRGNTEMLTKIVVDLYDFGVIHQYRTITSQHLGRGAITMSDGKIKVSREGGFGTSAIEKKATLGIAIYQTPQQALVNQLSTQIMFTRFGIENIKAVVETDFSKQRFFAGDVKYLGGYKMTKKVMDNKISTERIK